MGLFKGMGIIKFYMCRVLLSGFGVLLVLNNAVGSDDKNILLFLGSPPFWILENISFIGTIPMWLLYVLTLSFWFGVGYGLDRLIVRRESRKETE